MALNLMGIYESFRGGQEAARQNRLLDIAEQARQAQGAALQGNKQALNDLAGLDPQAYAQTKGTLDDQKRRDTAEFLGAAYAAKTPEAWRSVVDRFKAKGHQFDEGEDLFENRENLLRQGMTVAEQMGIDLKGKELAAETERWERQFAAEQSHRTAQLDLERQKLAASEGGKLPSGYRRTADGNMEYIPGGPADPTVKASQGAGGVTTKMRNDAFAVDQAYRNLDTALQNYDALIQKTGASALPGQDQDKITQARTNLQLQLKELYNLGVLNGPDLSLMQQMIFDPQVSPLAPVDAASKIAGSVGGFIAPALPKGARDYLPASVGQRATSSISDLRGMLKSIRDNKTRGILDENGGFIGGGGGQTDHASAIPEPDVGPQQEGDTDALLNWANDVISRGADPQQVKQRILDEYGFEVDLAE